MKLLDKIKAYGIWDTQTEKWVQVLSGKYVWASVGAAKNAFMLYPPSKEELPELWIKVGDYYRTTSFNDQKRYVIKQIGAT